MLTVQPRELAPHIRPDRPLVYLVACTRTGRPVPYGVHVDLGRAEAHLARLLAQDAAGAAEAERVDQAERRADRARIAERLEREARADRARDDERRTRSKRRRERARIAARRRRESKRRERAEEVTGNAVAL